MQRRSSWESDLSDLSYLYRFGEYISEQELQTAGFLNRLPEETIRCMADTYTDGYIRGFAVMGRDLSKKKTVLIRYPLGFERMIRQAVKNFEAHGLSVIFMRQPWTASIKTRQEERDTPPLRPISSMTMTTGMTAPFIMIRRSGDRKLSVLKTAYEQYKKEAAEYAGPAVVETFGEESFSPVNKEEPGPSQKSSRGCSWNTGICPCRW